MFFILDKKNCLGFLDLGHDRASGSKAAIRHTHRRHSGQKGSRAALSQHTALLEAHRRGQQVQTAHVVHHLFALLDLAVQEVDLARSRHLLAHLRSDIRHRAVHFARQLKSIRVKWATEWRLVASSCAKRKQVTMLKARLFRVQNQRLKGKGQLCVLHDLALFSRHRLRFLFHVEISNKWNSSVGLRRQSQHGRSEELAVQREPGLDEKRRRQTHGILGADAEALARRNTG